MREISSGASHLQIFPGLRVEDITCITRHTVRGFLLPLQLLCVRGNVLVEMLDQYDLSRICWELDVMVLENGA